MGLNIKNPHVERLAAEVARLAGENKTEAIRRALEERHARLLFRRPASDRAKALERVLERDVWSKLPRGVRGRRLTKADRERALGYGPEGI